MSKLHLEFGFKTKDDIHTFLKTNTHLQIVMDLSCYDPQDFYPLYPHLIGSFAALFCDENKKIEVHCRSQHDDIIQSLKAQGYHPTLVSFTSCGFVFPRTIAMIVNEAYFALEEGVASKEDINRAMKFGVNYPKGPFEWSQGKEKYFVVLLDELFQKTLDKRYQISRQLLS